MKVIILAGGSGTRLWPISRDAYPKQFVDIGISNLTLFQQTFSRSMLIVHPEDIIIVANKEYNDIINTQIDNLGVDRKKPTIILEPEAKNTLPAIFSAVFMFGQDTDETFIVFPSDHIIKHPSILIDEIKSSTSLAKENIITFGIPATSPNTGYGYIKPDYPLEVGYKVKEFKEKPNLLLAKEYVNQGYFWNSGIFMFGSKFFIDQTKRNSPEIYEAFVSSASLEEAYSNIKVKISIDYGILEKTENIVVVRADVGWNDVGSFDSLYEMSQKDENGNFYNGSNLISLSAFNNFVHSTKKKTVSLIGISNCIIVDTEDAILVCSMGDSQRVKEVVEENRTKRTG